MKEYVVRTVAGEDIEAFLNAKAKEGYVVLNMQPVARRLREDTQNQVVEEIVYSFVVTMEREVPIISEEKEAPPQ